MSNIVHLNLPSRADRLASGRAAMAENFARARRSDHDVFWLKENAEFLNILECTGTALDERGLAAFEAFYDGIADRMAFFPQYYRFLLSICLDLEDLGIGGETGARLVDWVHEQDLAGAEMSDLQRAEARRLMMRRGRDPMAHDPGFNDRLRAFIARSQTFVLPNKKAAYELTHVVFYLSEYGRKDPGLTQDMRDSLDFAGTLAFLDLNADLLAEICVAMRYGGITPPAQWEEWLDLHLALFQVERGAAVSLADDYHEYLVCHWRGAVAGHAPFAAESGGGRVAYLRPETGPSALRPLSDLLYQAPVRSGDWTRMKPVIAEGLGEETLHLVSQAESACRDFDAFFEGFARSQDLSGPAYAAAGGFDLPMGGRA